jgi:cation transport ATPase
MHDIKHGHNDHATRAENAPHDKHARKYPAHVRQVPIAGPHSGHTVEGFQKRFWVSLLATIPILILTPQLHELLGVGGIVDLPGQYFMLLGLSSFIYFYGGYPFLPWEVAETVADKLGIDEVFAGVLPQEKADKVKEVQSRGLLVAMTGDGVNDAPALAQSDLGIAIGSGTDVAIETADIILTDSNPLDVVKAISLSRATYSKMIQNLAWATGYNAFAIPLAAGILYNYGILLNPAFGATLMSISTIIVALNAKLLRQP